MEEGFTISPGDRQHVEYLSDLFALIIAIEKVEKAMLRDLIQPDQYNTTIRRLLEKYKSTVLHLEQARNPYYTTIESFWENYGSRCPAARSRIQVGLSAGDMGAGGEQAAGGSGMNPRHVLECGQYFITLMDSLKLQQNAVDQLYTLLTDLINGLKRLGVEDQDYYQRLAAWKERLDHMNASDELNERDAREFAYILDRGYQGLYAHVSEHSPQSAVR